MLAKMVLYLQIFVHQNRLKPALLLVYKYENVFPCLVPHNDDGTDHSLTDPLFILVGW